MQTFLRCFICKVNFIPYKGKGVSREDKTETYVVYGNKYSDALDQIEELCGDNIYSVELKQYSCGQGYFKLSDSEATLAYAQADKNKIEAEINRDKH